MSGDRVTMNKTFSPEQFRMAAFDLDGTVLHRGRISERVRKALTELRRSGVRLLIASGRDAAQISSELMSLFDYAVLANGSYTIDSCTGKTVFTHPMDTETVCRVIKTVRKSKGGAFLFLNGEMWGTVKGKNILLSRIPFAKRLSAMKEYSVNSCVSPRLEKKITADRRDVFKIQCFFRSQTDSEKAAEKLRDLKKAEVLTMTDATLEITAKGITKAVSLRELTAALGSDTEHMAAFGDSVNDMEMLKNCGFAVAMENGDSCVKEIADYIAGDVRHDGAAAAIYALYGIDES